jgi:5-methylcytosine-specific restriction endonuclease McrA
MPNSLVSSRHVAFLRQGERCYYCNCPMWEASPGVFAVCWRVTLRQAVWLQCTAEHVVPKSVGGNAGRANIVAACRYCNQGRHKAKLPLDAPTLRTRVRRLVAKGRWLRPGFHRLALQCTEGET